MLRLSTLHSILYILPTSFREFLLGERSDSPRV